MNDQAVGIIRVLAIPLSIKNTDGIVEFRLKGELKSANKPLVKVPEQIVEDITKEDQSDEWMKERLLNNLEIIRES